MSEEERLKLENELLMTKSKAMMINLYLDKLEEIERLNNCYCNRSDCGGRLNKNNEVYDSIQQRNEKAIEYIKNNYPVCAGADLLKILSGEDN